MGSDTVMVKTSAIFQRWRHSGGTWPPAFSLSLALLATALAGEVAAAGKSGLMGDNQVIKVGQKAPAIETIDLEGNKFSLESFKGRPLLVDFGSVICEACGEMVKEINRVKKKYAGTDLELPDGAAPTPGPGCPALSRKGSGPASADCPRRSQRAQWPP